MHIDAGDLDKRVTIQQPAESHADGEVTTSWTDLVTRWANVRPLSSRDYFAAGQRQGDVTHRVRIRYRSDVTSKMRLLLGTRILEIVGPPRDLEEAGVVLEMFCREKET